MLILGFIVLFAGLAVGFPMFLAFVTQSYIHSFGVIHVSMITVPQLMFTGVDHYGFVAYIFFVLSGFLMRDVGLTEQLVKIANTWVGHLPGGLAWVMIIATTIFGALTGSAATALAAIGLIMVPRMVAVGYPKRFSVSLMAVLSPLGALIPPSGMLILYGMVTETSVAALFIAGVVPGLLYAVVMAVVASFYVWRAGRRGENWGRMPPASWGERGVSLIKGIPALTFPVIILGGIYGGFFSPTEAAGVATLYALIIGLAYRRLTLTSWENTCREAIRILGMIFLLIGSVVVFGKVMAIARYPHQLAAWLASLGLTINWFLFAVVVAYIFIGLFAEAIIIIFVTVPILYPTVLAMGIDPVHFGIVVLMACILASCTPPVGIQLFNASAIFRMRVEEVIVGVIPFAIAQMVVMFIVAYVPVTSLWLPRLGGLM